MGSFIVSLSLPPFSTNLATNEALPAMVEQRYQGNMQNVWKCRDPLKQSSNHEALVLYVYVLLIFDAFLPQIQTLCVYI